MKKILFTLALTNLLIICALPQDCTFYYPEKKGAVLEYKSYDHKDNLTGTTRSQVKDFVKNGNNLSAVIETEAFDKKGKPLGTNEFTVKCENGIFYIDMKNFMNPQTMEAYKDMEVSVKSDNLLMPSNMKVGDKLNDGSLVITVSNAGMKIMTMTTTITNRKVDAKEKITTPAGTFECYKISYDMTTKMMMTIKLNAVEWYAKDVGMVKSESYKDGKLSGSTVLTSIE